MCFDLLKTLFGEKAWIVLDCIQVGVQIKHRDGKKPSYGKTAHEPGAEAAKAADAKAREPRPALEAKPKTVQEDTASSARSLAAYERSRAKAANWTHMP